MSLVIFAIAAFLLYKNWGKVKGWIKGLTSGPTNAAPPMMPWQPAPQAPPQAHHVCPTCNQEVIF
jgi:hypothetical protein